MYPKEDCFITNSNIDFSTYEGPCVKILGECEGNACFITEHFALSAAHVVTNSWTCMVKLNRLATYWYMKANALEFVGWN